MAVQSRDFNPADFTYITWDELSQLNQTVFELILEGGKEFDRIVPLANGGLTMARDLADRLALSKISPLQVSYYTGINERAKEPRIVQPLSTSIAGERILIFEDVVDTGASVQFAKQYLLDQGAKSVEVATLVQKPHSKVQAEYAGTILSNWVIFPYETRETIQELTNMWLEEGLGMNDVLERLPHVGFLQTDIMRYVFS